jgi:coatomer protein complex subunit gamma
MFELLCSLQYSTNLFPPQTEATEVFFSVTKLFQSRDSNLRRMVYLVIKEICPSADEVVIKS